MKRWLCVLPGSTKYFTKNKVYVEGNDGLIDDRGYHWLLSACEFNGLAGGGVYLFIELTFEKYVKQAEMCL